MAESTRCTRPCARRGDTTVARPSPLVRVPQHDRWRVVSPSQRGNDALDGRGEPVGARQVVSARPLGQRAAQVTKLAKADEQQVNRIRDGTIHARQEV
eukprot:426152-Prymnesium_polylepis.3